MLSEIFDHVSREISSTYENKQVAGAPLKAASAQADLSLTGMMLSLG